MRISLVDPSLFTLPYDRALASALHRAGDAVILHGRPLRPDDGDPGDIALRPDFYPLSEHARARRLPAPLRLGLKGADHAASLLRFAAALRACHPDIIHVQWLPLPWLDAPMLRWLQRVAPLVMTVHDTCPFNGNPAASLQRIGFHRALKIFDRLIVHTDQGRSRLQAMGIPSARIAVIPHGPLAEPRAASAPDTGHVQFLLFGKIKPYKGADLLIEAFGRLPAALRDRARLRIVGQPHMPLDPLLRRASELGVGTHMRIEPDFVADSDIRALFGPTTVAVFPYREIEASGVLSLAIAHGTPILASRLGAFAEMLTHGTHGLLFEPGDIDGLADALAHAITDAAWRASAGTAVRALADTMPSWTDIADRTRLLYRDVRRTGRIGITTPIAYPAQRGLS